MKKFIVTNENGEQLFEGTRRQCKKFTRTSRALLKVVAVTEDVVTQPEVVAEPETVSEPEVESYDKYVDFDLEEILDED